jgi:hypothetical protein
MGRQAVRVADRAPPRRIPPVMNLYDADDALQDGPLTEPEPLRDLIIAQGMQETGIFVLLFTGDTAAPDSELTRDDGAAETVSRKAEELGVDTARLTLFSDDAYLLQAGLGETFVPQPGPTLLQQNA